MKNMLSERMKHKPVSVKEFVTEFNMFGFQLALERSSDVSAIEVPGRFVLFDLVKKYVAHNKVDFLKDGVMMFPCGVAQFCQIKHSNY